MSSTAGPPADDPGLALKTLADTTLAQAKRRAHGSPDPRVSTAFQLGWQMAEIYRPDPQSPPAPGEDDHLPELSDLTTDEWTRIGLYQVQAGITKLRLRIAAAGLWAPDAQLFAQELEGTTGEPRDAAIEAFHIELLAALTAADFRLGKGYGLGRALADVTRNPADWRRALAPQRVATLAAWLRQLSTTLPPHAGHVIATSLEKWGSYAQQSAGDPAQEQLDVALLQAQGRLWRSLISGEKRATEMLEMQDYVTSAESLLQSTGRLARPVLMHHAPLLIAAAVLFAVGIAVMLIFDDAAGIVSGAGVILTGLGIGWKEWAARPARRWRNSRHRCGRRRWTSRSAAGSRRSESSITLPSSRPAPTSPRWWRSRGRIIARTPDGLRRHSAGRRAAGLP
jgi:hypothetical protein